MAFYYVKNGGTATGDAGRAATQRTGTFAAMGASAYYSGVTAALAATTAPAAGDFICCSHLHLSGDTVTVPLTFGDDDITVISVDDANAENYLKGARENTTSGSRSFIGTNGSKTIFWGMSFEAEDDIIFNSASTSFEFNDCDISPNFTGAATPNDNITFGQDGIKLILINCSIRPAATSTAFMFNLNAGSHIEVIGGSKPSQTTDAKYLVNIAGGAGGTAIFDGFDASTFGSFELASTGTAANDDNSILILRNCEFPSTWTLGETPLSPGTVYDVQNCDDGNNRSISAFRNKSGQMITSNSVYANGADQVEGQNLSLEVQTESSTSVSNYFRFKIGTVRADFSTSKTITVELVHDALGSGTGSRFQNNELWLEVYRPNSADPSFLLESSGLSEPFDTATTNATSSETWTGTSMTSETTEIISVSTTAGGGTGWADVYVNVGVASIGIGDLFISHDIDIS